MLAFCRSRFLAVLVMVTLQGGAVLLLYNWTVQVKPPAASNRRVHVLLLSSWRSGSTFMGQVFDRHASVFYVKEPLRYLWFERSGSKLQPLQTEAGLQLHSNFHCKFVPLQKPHSHDWIGLQFWPQTRALCSPPQCPRMPPNQFTNVGLCRKLCSSSMQRGPETACSSHQHLVFKVVRLFELEPLYPLLQDPDLDLRIIHLVRDPRAVSQSRAELGTRLLTGIRIVLDQKAMPFSQAQVEVMKEICRSHLGIYHRAVAPPPFLKGRYRMVRYEDMVRNPLQEIIALFEFVGLTMTEALRDWIYTQTHGGQVDRTGTAAFRVSPRNAVNISQAWRTKLSHPEVQRVQEVCEEAMSLLGYRAVKSKKEQEDMSVDLLLPLQPNSTAPPKTEDGQV